MSTETRLSRKLPPPLIWEFTKGTGYASPAIAGDRLVFLHRVGDEEIVECLHAETGATNWRFRYPTDFDDRYGYNNGPRSSPVIDAARAYTMGAQGQLHCLDLETGKLVWKRELQKEYRVVQDFFGTDKFLEFFETCRQQSVVLVSAHSQGETDLFETVHGADALGFGFGLAHCR